MTIKAGELIVTIERMYGAVGNDDQDSLRQVLCEDFHAFENAVRMSGHELLQLMRRHFANGRRYRWSVTSPQVEVQGDLGVVMYLNACSMAETPDADPVPLAWLETALLRRGPSGWRVAFLHSTRTKAG